MDGSLLDGLTCEDFCHDWYCDGSTDTYKCARPGCKVSMSAAAAEHQVSERDLDLIYLELEARK